MSAIVPGAVATPAGPVVVVAGDALVDLTPTATTRGTSAYEPHPGGSCLNVAVGLARLGIPTSLLARVSDDGFGRLLRAHLSASRVLPTHLMTTSEVTGLAAVHVEGGAASYSFHTAASADRGLRPEHLADLPDGGRLPAGAALHVGSIALVQEPQASTLDGLLRRETRQRLVSLDPNVRPSLVADRTSYLCRMAEWVALADIVKASDEDLSWLYPGESFDSVAGRWLEAGTALVLVTFGAQGAWAMTRRARVHLPAPSVDVVDTVGAGDAFTAGVLAHLEEAGQLNREAVIGLGAAELERLLSAAVAVAADTCTRAGAEPPYRAKVNASASEREAVRASVAELVERARELAGSGGRRILGITGAPGAGKSTVAGALVEALGSDVAVLVPMDGFHLSNATLRALGRRGRKGAWDTFDADGYVDLLRRLRSCAEPVVHAPDFDRDVDESIGSALPIRREVPLVVTEGNYLLSSQGSWALVAPLLDESWFLDVDDTTRQDRLAGRHVRHGMAHDQAVAWARGTDQTNAELVARGRSRADLIVAAR